MTTQPSPAAAEAANEKPQFLDDKSPHCVPFILRQLSHHQAQHPDKPFFIGLNGVQGAGKTTLVSALQTALQDKGLETLVCSIDDLYLTHEDQVKLAQEHADNMLVQHRGEMGTHDIPLARTLFHALHNNLPTLLPTYSKSAFSGAGDRTPSSLWTPINQPSQPPLRVIILEGWCVGFRALSSTDLSTKYISSLPDPDSMLPEHRLEHLEFVNEKASDYDVLTDAFDAFIHVDAREIRWVYEWRREQEEVLRREMGEGMSDEQVVRFVNGYYPAYELYTEGVREGVLKGAKAGKGKQLRLVVGRDRKVVEVVEI